MINIQNMLKRVETDEWLMQINWVDGSIKKKTWNRSFYFDCKHNLIKEKDGSYLLYLEWAKGNNRKGWFRTSQADRIYHVNVEHNISIFYDLKQLRNAVIKQHLKGKYKPQTQKHNANEKFILLSNTDSNFNTLFKIQY